MQRLVYFFFVTSFCCNSLFAESYFDQLNAQRLAIARLSESVPSYESSPYNEGVANQLQGVLNRLGAAESELCLLTLMVWVFDLGEEYYALDNPEFLLFEQRFMNGLRKVLAQEISSLEFYYWVIHWANSFFVYDIEYLAGDQLFLALNALTDSVLVEDQQTGALVTRFPEDVEAFFEAYNRQHNRGTTIAQCYADLIEAVSHSLFNLCVEIAALTINNPSMQEWYTSIMDVVTHLYHLIGRRVPSPNSIRLGRSGLADLTYDNTGGVQQRSPHHGALSPREIFHLPLEDLVREGPLIRGAVYYHHRRASEGSFNF